MALKGKSVVVQVSVDDSTYYIVSNINDCDMSIDGDNQDVSVFGEDYINRLQGLKDVSWSISGFYDPTDTNGQVAIRSALINDSNLYLKISFDGGSTSFKQKVLVSSFNPSASVDGVVEISVDFEGDGVLTIA